jgi:cytochrome c oxidase assembly protein subunit 15
MTEAVTARLLAKSTERDAIPVETAPLGPWLHRWAVLTVAATIVLLGLGSAVTTIQAGLADKIWPTSPTALMESSPEQLANVRYVVEHSHRLAGYVVGCCVIVLAVWLWLREPRRWLCWLGVVALVGVSLQGLVGGLRVTQHARWGLEFRILHGCFAQAVLALLVSLAVLTWPRWRDAELAAPATLRRWSLFALGLVYLQIVFGVFLRHTYHPLFQRLHLLTAFAALAAIVWVVKLAFERRAGDKTLTVAAGILACLVGLQLLLGVEAWMVQLSSGMLPDQLPLTSQRIAVRTAHVLGGSLLLSATVLVCLLSRRGPREVVA